MMEVTNLKEQILATKYAQIDRSQKLQHYNIPKKA